MFGNLPFGANNLKLNKTHFYFWVYKLTNKVMCLENFGYQCNLLSNVALCQIFIEWYQDLFETISAIFWALKWLDTYCVIDLVEYLRKNES